MVFNSANDLKKFILSKSKIALSEALNKTYEIIGKFVKQYYSEYDPYVYERTYQLYKSLVKTDVISTGNGYKAYVYFDLSSLDYSIKHMTKIQKNGFYINPYNGARSYNGEFPNTNGDAEKSFMAAAHGSHGGKTSGTAIWDESFNVLNGNLYKILKRYLVANGIPVK